MTILKEIMNNLNKAKLSSTYSESFYPISDWKPSPITIDYNKEKDYRLLYDGIYNDNNGNIFEFQVGIISSFTNYYEFFVEDYIGNSQCKCFTDFKEALKLFINLSYIRNPIVYKDDEIGNAVKSEIRVKPYAKVSK